MLRNDIDLKATGEYPVVLNEVLSLNAQESADLRDGYNGSMLLNEVLSLNAQECHAGPVCSI